MDAWRRAGRHAVGRLAFDDAADAFDRALISLDEIPDAAVATRAELLLELADAQMVAGRAEQGRASCLRTAELARGIGSSEILARAALAAGRTFVYATIDQSLVRLLEEALSHLDDDELRLRALLLARLAAALQPSVPPEKPLDLAREAIELARRLDDPRTLLLTLQSAVSALMDLGDAEERLALNREHVLLATALGDPVTAFRGHLRVMIDALELGLIGELEKALAAAADIADATGLPHQRWIVHSARAMRHTMTGQFEAASSEIACAVAFAEQVDDPNSTRCIQFQRLALLRSREQHAETVELGTRLATSSAAVPGAASWLVPTVGGALARCEVDPGLLPVIDEATVQEILALGDRGAMCGLAEMTVCAGDRDRAGLIYRRLQEWAGLHAHQGLTGLTWEGPVSRCLALLAELLGRRDEADRWFELAAIAASEVDGRPMVARIAYEHGRTLARRGDGDADRCLDTARRLAEGLALDGLLNLIERCGAREERPPGAAVVRPDPTPSLSIERDGELWLCRFGQASFRLKDSKGVRFLAALVARPGVEQHVLELYGESNETAAVDTGDAGELLDERAKTEYRQRIEALRGELDEATAWNDGERAARLRAELDLLTCELSRAFGLGGRTRRAGSASERARVNVQRRLRDAVRRIAAHDAPAGRHLEKALQTGTFCSYDPN